MKLPIDIILLILNKVAELKYSDYLIKKKHEYMMFSVLCDIISLPIKLECKNCKKISDKRYYCCTNMCEFCQIWCEFCKYKGCTYCIDIVDDFNKCGYCYKN